MNACCNISVGKSSSMCEAKLAHVLCKRVFCRARGRVCSTSRWENTSVGVSPWQLLSARCVYTKCRPDMPLLRTVPHSARTHPTIVVFDSIRNCQTWSQQSMRTRAAQLQYSRDTRAALVHRCRWKASRGEVSGLGGHVRVIYIYIHNWPASAPQLPQLIFLLQSRPTCSAHGSCCTMPDHRITEVQSTSLVLYDEQSSHRYVSEIQDSSVANDHADSNQYHSNLHMVGTKWYIHIFGCGLSQQDEISKMVQSQDTLLCTAP